MTPTGVEIVDIIVDPDPHLAAETHGAHRALTGCGPWPRSGTEAELRAALRAAGRELDRAATVWRRYCRRFDQLYTPIERAPDRLRARFDTAAAVFDHRIRVINLLTRAPITGSA